MYTCPPTPGRLLRFKGDVSHSVPRPTLAYYDEVVGGSNHVIYMRRRDDEEFREVVLFNTWSYEVEGDKGGEMEGGEEYVNDVEKWKERGVERSDGELLRLKVPLLGDVKRRGRVERFVELKVKGRIAADDSPHSYEIIGDI